LASHSLSAEQAAEVRQILEDDDYWRAAPIAEILEPSAPVAIRKSAPPIEIDADHPLLGAVPSEAGSAGKTTAETEEAIQGGTARPAGGLYDNPGQMAEPSPGGDMIEVSIPTRSGWLTRRMPRADGSGYGS
jgi:hypothetical protein